jgi:hypothetical protein
VRAAGCALLAQTGCVAALLALLRPKCLVESAGVPSWSRPIDVVTANVKRRYDGVWRKCVVSARFMASALSAEHRVRERGRQQSVRGR